MLPPGKTIWPGRSWICSSCKAASRHSLTPSRRRQSTQALQQLKATQKLPNVPARTRFAPSPTGYLHLGSLRTALYNYLLAKATGGQFLLRIEDTDRKRNIPNAEAKICEDLQWAGLQWDEGTIVGGLDGPYKQSERTAIYKEHAEKLLDSRHAYRCFCTQDRLDSLASERSRLGLPTDYDRACLGISMDESNDRVANGEPYVIRLETPAEYPEYKDLVYGIVGRLKGPRRGVADQNGYDDPILFKTDGSPTYHLANVVDDHLMRITHVIRGVEWMPSTPKHLELYRAFGWDPPAFAHVGLLQDANRRKLSKRDRNMDLEAMKADGILPEAMMNFVALLGWSHSLGSDFFTIKELVDNFSLKFTKGNVVVNFGKLKYLQGLHFQKLLEQGGDKLDLVIDQILALMEKRKITSIHPEILDGRSIRGYITALLQMDASSPYVSASLFLERNSIFLKADIDDLAQAMSSWKEKPQHEVRLIAEAVRRLEDIKPTQWTATALKNQLAHIVASLTTDDHSAFGNGEAFTDTKHVNGSLLSWLRGSLMGGQKGPSMFNVMEVLGRRFTLDRLAAAQTVCLEGRDVQSEKVEESI
ncbi:Glutamate--tRNA ligase mitochondrial [Lambiella insularis]|nr:Glutamate--tRNA ligase mitochondrial [Lambiella insularis]